MVPLFVDWRSICGEIFSGQKICILCSFTVFALLCLKKWGKGLCREDTHRLQRTFKDPRNHGRISWITFVGFPDYPQWRMHFKYEFWQVWLSWDGISTLNLQSRPTSQDLPTIKGAQMHSHRRANLNIIPSDPAKNPIQIGNVLINFQTNINNAVWDRCGIVMIF